MKKQLLFTIAFLGSITFAIAQDTAVLTDDLTTEVFTFGANKDLRDASIITLTAGAGSAQTNKNGWLALLSDAISDGGDPANYSSTDDTQGTIIFGINTASENINSDVTVTLQKRKGNTVNGNANFDGKSITIDEIADTTTENNLETYTVVLTDVVITPAVQNFTITMTSLLMGNQNSAGVPTLRIINVSIEKKGLVLALDENTKTTNGISVYPNPVNDRFQLASNETVESVQIYSISGSLLKTFSAATSYDISDLAAGIYFVNTGSKTIKIVKN